MEEIAEMFSFGKTTLVNAQPKFLLFLPFLRDNEKYYQREILRRFLRSIVGLALMQEAPTEDIRF